MKTKSLLVGLASLGLLLGACAPSAAAGRPAEQSAACAPSGQRLAAIALRPGESAMERAITWAPEIPADARKLVVNRQVAGACAASVKAFSVSVGALDGGETFAFDEAGAITPHDAGDLLDPASLEGPPPGGPGRFLMATRVEYRNGPDGMLISYLGLWRDGGRWTVASFSQRGAANVGEVRPVLSSTLPIVGVSYFPAPDTQSGQVSLTLRDTPRTTGLLAFSWRHPQWSFK